LDTLLSMRVFTKVVEAENFTEAARRLKLSPRW
jgi:DNA-binding transcriptional LysR family regulator